MHIVDDRLNLKSNQFHRFQSLHRYGIVVFIFDFYLYFKVLVFFCCLHFFSSLFEINKSENPKFSRSPRHLISNSFKYPMELLMIWVWYCFFFGRQFTVTPLHIQNSHKTSGMTHFYRLLFNRNSKTTPNTVHFRCIQNKTIVERSLSWDILLASTSSSLMSSSQFSWTHQQQH